MSAILALTFCAIACKTDDDDPTMYTVTVSSSIEHGKVSVDKTSAEAGATVKLAATADSGYELDSYNVKDEKSNTITVKDGTFTMPESNVTVSATFKETAETVNQKAVAAVIAKITAISTVTYTDESKEKIDDARAAYEALTEAQKELVPEETLALLTAAETKYAELKAAAEPKNASYTVKHFQQNIADNNYTLKESETKTGTVGQPTDASAKSYEGFTAQTVTQVTVAASGTEVEIKYNRNTYTVTFDSNGGSDVSSQSLRYGATATEPADPTKTATTTTKYTFDAWYSDSGLTTPFSFDTAIKKDITLYAKWTETAVTPQKAAGSISYATTSVSKTTAAAAFTNTLTNTGDGAVTYASSKTAVAEVNTQNGLVTIKGAGETTITATVADTDNYTYATKTASYTLTVTEASPLTLKLKTGADINSILVKLCKNDYGYPACTKFARSATNKEEATLYLDTEEKYIPVWSEGTEVYYYVPDGYTPVMNEDSSAMFLFCTELTSLDVTGFDTSNVTNMAGMFYGCSGLTSLDLSKFDTGNVTNMSAMFMGCSGLISLDVSKFVTSNVTVMSSMFFGCKGLTSLDVSKFVTGNVTDMSGMFSGCSGLASLDVSKFVTSNVTDMSEMFSYCSGLTNLDVTGFNTSNVKGMNNMFSDCSKLTSLDVSKFVTSNVQNMEEMFSGCEGLTSLDVSKFVTSNVKSMKNMFSGCSKLTSLNVTGFNTGNVTDMYGMFEGCSGLKSLDVSGFNTSEVTMMTVMFNGCKGLTSLDVSKFVTSSVTGMSYMFSGCEGLTSLDLSKFDTSNVTDMKKMFSGCKELMTIYATDKFVTTSVNNGDDCFEQCSKLVGGSGTTYDENNIYVTYARIDGGPDSASPGYFTLKLIGSKSKPDAVGDIVFSDGSATPYSEGLTLTDEEKNAAIAVIYYAGSASDTLGAKTLGVGLKNTGTDSLLAWAKNIDTNITAIQCTPAYEETEPEPADEETEPADEETAAATATFTGDTDGSDNWKTLCDAVSDEGTSGNYPAWEWVNAYATENSLADSYANGWYLPTVAELSMLYRVKDTVNSALEKAGGTKIADTVYWSSSQVAASYIHTAWTVDFGYGTLDDYGKDVKWSVCTVRAF
jgi:uncharacterized repeat protein (TIGR02543 family)